MAFPVMNVYTSIRDENKENNPVNLVLKRYEKIRDILGTCTVMSDGKLKKGSTSDLIIERAYFDICDDPNRIYWKDEKNFFGADFYFCDNSSVIIAL